jgi:hypothetical protein
MRGDEMIGSYNRVKRCFCTFSVRDYFRDVHCEREQWHFPLRLLLSGRTATGLSGSGEQEGLAEYRALASWKMPIAGRELDLLAQRMPRNRQPEIDARAFPIRIFVRVPEEGFASLGPELEPRRWLMRHLPAGEFAWHTAPRNPYIPGDHAAVYFRTIEAASSFLRAVPVEVADGTRSKIYTTAAR